MEGPAAVALPPNCADWFAPVLGAVQYDEMGAVMTDEDRALLSALARLNDACGVFGMGVLEDNLTDAQHVEMVLQFVAMAGRVLRRMGHEPRVVESGS